MSSLTLAVMAAGIGSRYGGLKQIDPVGPRGEIVIDYSVYDALRAGFDRIVFIIRKDIEAAFRDKIGRTVESRVDTEYVFQDIGRLPEGFSVPPGRTKPWGTAHALLCSADVVRTPFAAVNADDFYGRTAFAAIASHMRGAADLPGLYDFAMVGYIVANTLSANGSVTRGVCATSPDGYLRDIRERSQIRQFPDGVKFSENGRDWIPIPAGNPVSMNLWGFTTGLFRELRSGFPEFLRENAPNVLKAEYLIPEVVGGLVRGGKARVKVLPTGERWFGVTYPEDRPIVQAAIRDLVSGGLYPENLWGK
jgi:hypothetical protein